MTEPLDFETWREVPGYEAYAISSLGRVKRIVASDYHPAGKILKQQFRGNYLCLNLWRGGVKKLLFVHHLVMLAFEGPRPDGHEVNHLDGVKIHNWRSNLEYCTVAENHAHAARTGLSASGERHGGAKLTEVDVLAIRRRFAEGFKQTDIAATFGVSASTVHLIAAGKIWKRIPVEAL